VHLLVSQTYYGIGYIIHSDRTLLLPTELSPNKNRLCCVSLQSQEEEAKKKSEEKRKKLNEKAVKKWERLRAKDKYISRVSARIRCCLFWVHEGSIVCVGNCVH
jgi:hypothetical protein